MKLDPKKNAQIAAHAMDESLRTGEPLAITYHDLHGHPEELIRYTRVFEALETHCPIRLRELAQNHFSKCRDKTDDYFYRLESSGWDMGMRELSHWCKALAKLRSHHIDRLDAAFTAIEKLALDPEQYYRTTYYQLADKFAKAIVEVDQELSQTTLKGKKLREERWARYQEVAIRSRDWGWDSYFAQLASLVEEI